MGKDILQIALAFIAVGTVALVIGNARGATQIISAATGGFNSIMRTVTLQNQAAGVNAYMH